MTTRRGFLGSILALGAAPAIVRAESLMNIYVPPQEIVIVRRGGLSFAEEMAASIKFTKEMLVAAIVNAHKVGIASQVPHEILIPQGMRDQAVEIFLEKDGVLSVTRNPARFNLKR